MNGIAKVIIGLAAGMMLMPVNTSALSFTHGSSTTSVALGAGVGTQGTPVVVNATLSGLDTTIQINNLIGLTDLAKTGASGVDSFWISLVLVNNTGMPWVGFDHELQPIKGDSSSDPDGLSFAQGYLTGSRPWTSGGVFSSFTEDTQSRDAIIFSGGQVAAGGSVTFSYIINHSGDADPVYLQLRPTLGSSTSVPETLGTGWTLLGSAMALFLGFGWRQRGTRLA